ncbi:hypothetical protein QYF61_026705, partial [Mycteria americana]
MPSHYKGAEPICISGVTGGSQQLTVLEAKVSLTGNEWQKHPVVTGPEAPCILGIDYLRRGYFKDPKGYRWAFGIAALEMEEIKLNSCLPHLDPSVVGLLTVEKQQVPIATTMVHQWQYRTSRDSLSPIHKLIRRVESQGVISKTHSPFYSPVRPVRKSNGEWRLTVDYRGLNEVTPLLSAAMPDMLELQHKLESKAAKWYATTDIAIRSAGHSLLSLAGAFSTPGIDCPRGGNSPTICHKLIQTALEQDEAPEHLQYIHGIIVSGNTAKEVFEKGKKIIQILLKAGLAIVLVSAEIELIFFIVADRNGCDQLVVKLHHVDAHVPKSRATEELQNNQQVDQAAKIEAAQVHLDWQHKGELFIAQWAHDTSGHQGRDATYRWARDQGVDLTMDTIAQQAKQLKPLWYGGRWLKYKHGEAWQIDYITLPQTHQGKYHVLTMMEAATRWLETYPMPCATAQDTILGLEKQVLWRHGTPERTESDNGTHFQNNLIDTCAKEHGMEWVYHIPYHAPASEKIKQYNGLLKTTLRAMGGGTFKHWDTHLAKATWLVNTRGSANRAGPAQSELLHIVEGDEVPVVHIKNMLGKTAWVTPASGKGKPIHGIAFAQGPGCT